MQVQEDVSGNFALIHDAQEIKYEVNRNCNLTSVGAPFGEQPLAIAVRRGSDLQKELSKM
jgi:hypothetical protein